MKVAQKIEVHSPYDLSLITSLDASSSKDIEEALEKAHRAFRQKQAVTPGQRIAIFERVIAELSSRAEEFALQIAREGGKPLADARVEVTRAIDGLKLCIVTLRTQSGSVIPMNLNAASAGRLAFTQLEPIGVVVALSAFNHPLNLIVHQIAPAIAVGCPVIVKPASATPLSCLALVKIFHQAGLPEALCQVVLTQDHSLSEKLATDPRVAFLSFIGSAKVGWGLRAKLAPGTRCALEHGGVAPAIVAEDADLELAIPKLIKGAFYHAGQVCVSVKRIFAHEIIASKLAERLAEVAKQLKVGDPTRAETEVGPLISVKEVTRVDAWVQEAITQGAECLSGGKKNSDSCYAPTVLYNPPAQAKVSTQEIFGPVLCVYPYKNLEEAIAEANSLPYAFQASVFTRSIDMALQVYSQIDAASVMLNDHTAFRVDWMPFAGFQHSGLGVGGIPYTMREMQLEKLLVLQSTKI